MRSRSLRLLVLCPMLGVGLALGLAAAAMHHGGQRAEPEASADAQSPGTGPWRETAIPVLLGIGFLGALALVVSGVLQRHVRRPLRRLTAALEASGPPGSGCKLPRGFAAREIEEFACELRKHLDGADDEARELQRNAAELRLLAQITRLADRADDFDSALRSCCAQIARFLLWPACHVYLSDPDDPRVLVPSNIWHLSNPNIAGSLVDLTRVHRFRVGEGLPGSVLERREPVWIEDTLEDERCVRSAPGLNPIRSAVGFPIFFGQELIGVLELFDIDQREREIRPIALMHNIGLTLGQVLSRRRTQELLVRRNRELADALSDAQSSTRARTSFLANMGHEIRTPMTSILGSAELLAERPEEYEACVESIRRNGGDLLRVIDDVLALARIEAGRFDLAPEDCVLADLLHEVREEFEGVARERGLDFSIAYEGRVPERVRTDPACLREVLRKLIANGFKFTESGGVRVILVREGGDSDEPLWICVEDTGIGLDKDQVEQLFQPFSQADSSMSRRFGGAGLGLPLARRLVELLGGEISAEGRPGGGTRIRFSIAIGSLKGVRTHSQLPAPPRRGAVPEAAEPDTPARRETALDGVRVLLVEDGPDNRKLLGRFCSLAGAKVETAENGAIAVTRALEARSAGAPFDLILMDLQMPVMDGYQATGRLRREGFREPIVAITAHAMAGERERCIDLGCDDFLTKPIRRGDLIDALVRVLGTARGLF